LSEGQKVRDLWRQKEIGDMTDSFSHEVARHGVFLVRLSPTHSAR
jgi:hypothetical protein